MRQFVIHCIALAVLLGACAPGDMTAGASTSTSEVILPTQVAPSAPSPSGVALALTVWVPPDLSPDGPGPAAVLLADRLQAFLDAHPGLRLQVRIKGRSGPAGMMESLAAARTAAPSVLPDLVALDAAELARATAGGIIRPWQDAGTVPETWGLAETVLGSARPAGQVAGLPFAAEADLFAYDTLAYPAAPRTWADLLTANAAFLVPLGDPSATFTLGQYLAAGGTLHEGEGAPALDQLVLQEVLSFYAAARAGGLLPLTARQHEDSQTTGEALFSGRIDAAVVPFSRFAASSQDVVHPVGPWPTADGLGVCFLRTWVWAVTERASAADPLAIDLARWLADPEFSGPWTRALGLIPAGTSALTSWPADDLASLAGLLLNRCSPQPSPEDLALFGPVLRQAVEAALTGALSPEAAAARAVDTLRKP